MRSVPGMRSDDVCLIVALDVKVLLWFDLLLLLCTNHTHIRCDYWHKREAWGTAAIVLLMLLLLLRRSRQQGG